jgi:diguanylate cyclase (GGDEF)-like protein
LAGSRLRFAVLLDSPFASSYQEELHIGIERYVEAAGIDVIYFGVGEMNPANHEDAPREGFFDFIAPSQFDGLILVATSLVNVNGMELLRGRLAGLRGLPMVSIAFQIGSEDAIVVDNASGFRDLMDHLIKVHRFRRFAFVSGARSNPEAVTRLEVFRAALDRARIPRGPEIEFFGNFRFGSGLHALETLFDERKLKPEVIVCANDFMAMGVWEALRARGIVVPHDVAVTGFDDLKDSEALTLQLTTVHQSFQVQAYNAAKRLHDTIQGMPMEPLTLLPTELVVRRTCGCSGEAAESREGGSGRDPFFAATDRKARKWLQETAGGQSSTTVLREWGRTVLKAMERKLTKQDMDGLLHRARKAALASKGINRAAVTNCSAAMQSILSDFFVQAEVIGRRRRVETMNDVRDAIDALQREVNDDLDLGAHSDMLRRIAAQIHAGTFSIVEFMDGTKPREGSRIVFNLPTPGGGAAADGETPLPEVLLPAGRSSLVAAMLFSGNERYGYILMDAHAMGVNIFEYVRSRFASILKSVAVTKSFRRLNADLMREIGVRVETEQKLKEALSMVERLSISDELTGLYNRRGFLTLAAQQMKLLSRQGGVFIVLYADLDGLKRINDTWGHKEGDIAIQLAGQAFKEALRDSDIIARLGGDEFAALICMANPTSFESIKNRVLERCRKLNEERGKPWRLSMSIGNYIPDPELKESLEEMLDKADATLYHEKQKNLKGSGSA